MKKLLFVGFACFWFTIGEAQTTLSQVSSLFQANCTVGCHSGPSPSANLDLSGSSSELYDALVEVTPTNPAAAAKGYKLVDPGYPERSFLLRKIATTAWDHGFEMELSEGNNMPDGQPSLQKEEIELVRQWIMYGAPENDNVADTQLLYDYYHGMGKARIEAIPTPEDEGMEGYQVRMGPFFLPPLSEIEYRWKYDLQVSDSIEINRTLAYFNDESHHFILYRFKGGVGNFSDGFRPVNSGEFGSLNLEQVTAWAEPGDNVLPQHTAYKWEGTTILDLNYHILNYDADSILAAECYVNIYTQPVGTSPVEMKAVLLPINAIDAILGWGNIGEDLIIPNDGEEYFFSDVFALPGQNQHWYIWQLGSHTHSRGTDYDIYLRTPSGIKGEQIYEGFYNTEYTYNQGYYDWKHSAIKYFDPLKHVDMANGIIHEAKFVNNTPSTLYWGLTTEDEMMLIALQYTEEPLPNQPDGINDAERKIQFSASPNPFNDVINISYYLKNEALVKLEVYNALGEKVSELFNGVQNAGNKTFQLSTDMWSLPAGMYHVNLTVDGIISSKKIIKLN